MRLFEFEEPKELDILQNRCSEILSIYRKAGRVLYRGISGENLPYFIGEPPFNRPPKDTPSNVDQIINNKLRDAGFRALRSNSIFCSKSPLVEAYGELHAIFPFDGFDFSYSKYYDLTDQLPLEFETDELEDMKPDEFVEKLEYSQTNLSYALRNEVEVCIHGKYLAMKRRAYSNEFWINLLGFEI